MRNGGPQIGACLILSEWSGTGGIFNTEWSFGFGWHFARVARLQNETAPEKKLLRYEKGFEKREKKTRKRSETC